MTSTIQIPNITINGNDYWESHKSQYNTMIGESISPLTIDLKGYPVNNTISIVDPTDEYYYTDNNDEEIRNYPLTKNTNLNVKIGKMPEFWEVPRELTAQGVYGYPSSNFTVTLPDSVTSIDNYGLYDCFYNCSTITSFDVNNVTSIDNYGLYDCFDTCTNLTTVSNFDNVTTIGKYGLTDCFYKCANLITGPTFANLSTIGQSGLSSCFYNCSNLTTGPILGKVTSLTYSALYGCFSGCTSLTTAPTLASLTTIGSSAMQDCFNGCTSLTTPPTFAKLTSVSYQGLCYCFYNCTSLTTAPTFANLTTLTSGSPLSSCFEGCTSLTTPPTFDKLNSINSRSCLRNCFKNTIITSLSFPALKSTSFGSYTNQFDDMLNGVTGCTVHFPSNLQSVIGSWSSVTGGFGGTNTTVLFDLPATS